jgi:lysozyme
MNLKQPVIYDVYEGEAPIKWEQMNPKPLRAILRASIQFPGTRTRREDYEVVNYVAQCRDNGIKYGLYHFLSPNGIAEQAALFLGVWNKCGGADMVPIVDVEIDLNTQYKGTIGNAVWQGHIKTFLDLLSAGTGKTPMIYTSAKYWAFVMTRSGLSMVPPVWTSSYPLWVAGYPYEPDLYSAPFASHIPSGWTQWALWQYNDKGRTNGFLANDLNTASAWYQVELGDEEEPPTPPTTYEWPDKLIAHKGTETQEYIRRA